MTALLQLLYELDAWTLLVSAFDIVIVTFVIYRVLLLLRGTRAGYTLIGLLVVAGVLLAAQKLQLTTLRWLLDNLINYAIFIVIIVFQADIRRGLMRMGRRMFSGNRGTDGTSAIEQVVQACEAMAEKRIGALIVFERDVDLTDLIEAGTELQAQVSRALLTNIFTPWPDNALHDGAVVIKDQRVQQAGAVLPLSKRASLDRALGTRHRAGVGITEETDAVCIVVSEERGSLSLCTGGMLHASLTGPSLRRELLTRFTSDERPRQNWWDRATRYLDSRLGGSPASKAKGTSRPSNAGPAQAPPKAPSSSSAEEQAAGPGGAS